MNKRDNEKDISTDKVIDEFMKLYGEGSSKKKHKHHSSKSSHHHSSSNSSERSSVSSHHSSDSSSSGSHNSSEHHSSDSSSSGSHNSSEHHSSESFSNGNQNHSKHHHSHRSHQTENNDRLSSPEEFDVNGEKISNELLEKSKSRAVSKSGHHHHSHDHSYQSRNKKKKKKRSLAFKIIIGVLIFILSMILIAVGTFFFLQQKGKNNLNPKKDVKIEAVDDAVTYDNGKTIEYNGKKYEYNENIVTVLCLGVDQKNYYKNIKYNYGTAGQSDVLLVVAFDTKTGKTSVISIPRDSYVDVDVYATNGKFADTEKMQICLAYSYGDGNEKSCKNVIKSVERVLFGMPINSYAALKLKGIGPINDSIGGVTLTALETIDNFTKGQKVTLTGNSARRYVQQRNTDVLNSDATRRERQIQYIKAFANKAIKLSLKDIGTVKRIYNAASPYSITDMNLSSVVYLASTFLSHNVSFDNIVTLKGELVPTDLYPEYHLDKDALYETVLDVFYNEIG